MIRFSSACLAAMLILIAADPAQAFFSSEMVDPGAAQTRLATATDSSAPLAPAPPSQSDLEEPFTVRWNGYEITGHSGIGIEAVVLSQTTYRTGDLGGLVPFDLALAWGPVSAPDWIRHLRVKQSERLYRWSYPPGTSLTVEQVTHGSANMHMMPANDGVRAELARVREGDLVRISGYLVDISGPEDFTWKSSTVRSDTGRGSCELILVENIEIVRE